MIDEKIRQTAEEVYNYLQPYCIAIYLGGSSCQEYINNKHDIDFICFSNEPVDMCHIRRLLYFYFKEHKQPENYDFIQVRTKQREEHAYGSFINKMMIKLVGVDIDFKFDIINDNREEYKQILKDTIKRIEDGKIRNQKRWYQIYQGMCIMQNNSYELTEEQVYNINVLHDMNEKDLELRTKLIEDIKKEINSWQI